MKDTAVAHKLTFDDDGIGIAVVAVVDEEDGDFVSGGGRSGFSLLASIFGGGGCVEAHLSVWLSSNLDFLATLDPVQQEVHTFCLHRFSLHLLQVARCLASSLLSIPRLLAINAGFDGHSLATSLCHDIAATGDTKLGLDLEQGAVAHVDQRVLEPAASKVAMLQFAVETVCSLLKVDDIVWCS